MAVMNPQEGVNVEDRKELIRHVKKVGLTTNALVGGLQSGLHHSLFKGQGVEFAEIREYVPGDDVRSIDWKVTARFNHPFIKEYTEERDQTFYLAVDISGSGTFGSDTTKKRKMLEVTASLAFAALRNNDRIGLCLFSDRVEKFIPAKRGKKHLVTILNMLIDYTAVSQKTDVGAALKLPLPPALAAELGDRNLGFYLAGLFFATQDPATASRSDRDTDHRHA